MNAAMVPDRRAGRDAAAQVAADVARRWVRWYSGLVGTEAAERRRAEIESDLWEQRADAQENGRRSSIVAGSIALRVVGGIPDDLLWVRTQRLAMRGLQADRKASAMNTLGHTIARWWWVAGAAVLAALYLYFGIDNLVGAYAPQPGSAVQCFIALALMVAGIALRARVPRLAAILVAMAALPTLGIWWAWPIAVLGAAVAVGSIIEIVRLSAPGFLPRAAAVLGTLLLGATLVVPALGLGPEPIGDALLFVGLAVAVCAAGIALVVVTRARSTEPAEQVPTPSRVA